MLYSVCYAVKHYFRVYEYKAIIYTFVTSEKLHKLRKFLPYSVICLNELRVQAGPSDYILLTAEQQDDLHKFYFYSVLYVIINVSRNSDKYLICGV